MTSYSKKPDLDELKKNFIGAEHFHATQCNKIDSWLDLMFITNGEKFQGKPNKSKVQPKVVRQQAEWRYAVLSEPLLSTEDMFRVRPRTGLDRSCAKQNQLILNYQFNEQLDKVSMVDTYIRTLVNEGTAIVKVGWLEDCDEVEVEVPKYDYRLADAVFGPIIQEALQNYFKEPNSIESLPPVLQESVMKSAERGELVQAIADGTEMKTIKKTHYNGPTVDFCDYRNVRIDPTCGGDFSKAQFVVHSYDASLSDLEKTGNYDLAELKQQPSSEPVTTDGHEVLGDDSFTFDDQARKKFTVYEYWGYYDLYDTGKTVPMVAAWVEDTMIRCEESPFPHSKLPFVVVPYLPVKNSVYGEADAELIGDNQRIIGALTRSMIDTFASTAAGQKGFAKGAMDYTNQHRFKSGENFEYNPGANPDATIWTATQQELPVSAFNMLMQQNNDASAMTGIQAFGSGGVSGDSYGTTATGVTAAVGAQAKREFGISRRVVNGLKEIAKMVSAMNSEWLDDEEIIRITDDEFVVIDRDNLVGSYDISLTISTQETDTLKSNQLAFMLQTLGQQLPLEMTQLIFEDIAELNRMPALAKKIKEFKPEPTPEQQIELAKLQLELEEKKLQLAKLQSETNLNVEKAKEVSSKTDLNNLEYLHTEKGVDHARDMEKQQAQAEANTKRDAFNVALKNTTNEG